MLNKLRISTTKSLVFHIIFPKAHDQLVLSFIFMLTKKIYFGSASLALCSLFNFR